MHRSTNHFNTDMRSNESETAAPMQLVEKLKANLTWEQKTFLQIMANDVKSISIAQIHKWLLIGGSKQTLIILYAASGIFIEHEWYLKLPRHSEIIPVFSVLKDLTRIETAQNFFGLAYKMSLFELTIQTKYFDAVRNPDKTPSATPQGLNVESPSHEPPAENFNPLKRQSEKSNRLDQLPKDFESLTLAQLHHWLYHNRTLTKLYQFYGKTYTQFNAQWMHLPNKYVKDLSNFRKLGNATVEEVQAIFGEYYHYPFQGLHKVIRKDQLATQSKTARFDQPANIALRLFDQSASDNHLHLSKPVSTDESSATAPKVYSADPEITEQDLAWINNVIFK